MGAVSGVALVSSAIAADIYSPSAVSYAPAYVALPSWAGFYVGVNGGYGGNNSLSFGENVFFPNSPSLPLPPPFTNPDLILRGGTAINGGFGGGQLGYNFQLGSFVLA